MPNTLSAYKKAALVFVCLARRLEPNDAYSNNIPTEGQPGSGPSWVSGYMDDSLCGWHLADPAECQSELSLDCNWVGCNVAFNATHYNGYYQQMGGADPLPAWLNYVNGSLYQCAPWNASRADEPGYVHKAACGPDYPALIGCVVPMGVLVGAVFLWCVLPCSRDNARRAFQGCFQDFQRFLPCAKKVGEGKRSVSDVRKPLTSGAQSSAGGRYV